MTNLNDDKLIIAEPGTHDTPSVPGNNPIGHRQKLLRHSDVLFWKM